jgi:iron complex outermembrane receptor protein
LEQIVVTARRRDESLQDVPISIISTSGEILERSHIDGVTELDRVVPGFVFNEFEGGQQSTAMLRGLSTYSFETHAPQSVGVVVDDVVLDTIGQSVSEFNDIDRIEVLRGPQGTLFGRNTTGGVVHIITNDPIDEFEGKASLTYGSYDEVKWNGTLNLPITGNIASRTSVFTGNREGYIENIHEARMLGSQEQAGIRSKFLYTPNENTELKLGLAYIEREQTGRADPVVAFGPFASDQSREINAGIAGPENDKVNGIGYHLFDEQQAGASVTWDQAIGDYSLTSITAFEYWDFQFGVDEPFRTFNDPVEPLSTKNFYVPHELRGWSEEVRLASPEGERLQYVVGAFISGTDSTERRDFLFNAGDDPDPAAAIWIFDLVDQDNEHLDYAVFGEADFDITETVTLTTGLRWTHDETDISVDARPAPFLIPEIGIGIGPLGELYIPILDSEFPGFRQLSVSADEWTWRVGPRWQPTSDLMVYGMVARGFKGPTITALSILSPVDPEIVTNYELGVKTGFLDNRVTANLTLFRADIDDFQAQGEVNIDLPGEQEDVTQIFLTNAAEARSQGVEFEMSAALTDDVTFDVGLAYIDATFKSYPDAACFDGQTEAEGCVPLDPTDPASPTLQDLSDRQLPLVPEWSGNAALSYDFSVPFWSASQFLRLDYYYRDEINWNSSLAPLTTSEAVGIWGLTLGLSSPDERLELVGYIKNLTDEYFVNGLNGGNGTISAELLPEYQRTAGITVNLLFQ